MGFGIARSRSVYLPSSWEEEGVDALSRSPIQGEDTMLVPEENLVAAVASPLVSVKSGEGSLG